MGDAHRIGVAFGGAAADTWASGTSSRCARTRTGRPGRGHHRELGGEPSIGGGLGGRRGLVGRIDDGRRGVPAERTTDQVVVGHEARVLVERGLRVAATDRKIVVPVGVVNSSPLGMISTGATGVVAPRLISPWRCSANPRWAGVRAPIRHCAGRRGRRRRRRVVAGRRSRDGRDVGADERADADGGGKDGGPAKGSERAVLGWARVGVDVACMTGSPSSPSGGLFRRSGRHARSRGNPTSGPALSERGGVPQRFGLVRRSCLAPRSTG